MISGALAGLLSRSVVVLDRDNKVEYTEQVQRSRRNELFRIAGGCKEAHLILQRYSAQKLGSICIISTSLSLAPVWRGYCRTRRGRKEQKVLWFEQHRHIAGHCHDAKNEAGITIHTCGPHIFPRITRKCGIFVGRFSDFNYYQHGSCPTPRVGLYLSPSITDTIIEIFGIHISASEVPNFLAEQVRSRPLRILRKHSATRSSLRWAKSSTACSSKNYTREAMGAGPLSAVGRGRGPHSREGNRAAAIFRTIRAFPAAVSGDGAAMLEHRTSAYAGGGLVRVKSELEAP
jgi:hypothetical protein